MKKESDSTSAPMGELQPIVADTETITQTETEQPEAGQLSPEEPGSLAAQLEAAEQRLRQVRSDYGTRLLQLEEDSAAEHRANEALVRKIEALEKLLEEQTQAALEKTKVESENL